MYTSANSWEQGIYISQPTLEDKHYLNTLIRQSKNVGINTFIIDLKRSSSRYKKNINLVKTSGLKYVARIVVFPKGGTKRQVKSMQYWMKIYRLVDAAIGYGAQEIQLDYIRYNTKRKGTSQNSKDVYAVIKWFKNKLEAEQIPLQIDVFGETSYKESKHIGQNIKLFADAVDVVCPMLYPSHFEPYKKHARQPYQTVYKALLALKAQFNQNPPFKVIPYIELYNYRYPLSSSGKQKYIKAQIQAAIDAHVDGWYAWSPNNRYHLLFKVLQRYPDLVPK